MALTTRSSVLAIKPEVTEGTPVKPTAAADYLALQDDFSMTPSVEVQENAEIKNSLGAAKGILGLEAPSVSFSHYLRGSGVEGQAPNYKEVLEAAFGTEHVRTTERDTVAGSTVSSLNVDAGEGVDFARGHLLLIKDGTNGYAIRPVHSVSVDALTLGFTLANAPATGVNLGKGVSYLPANSGHQALSVWHYIANGGNLQMATGCKVTSLDATMEAGSLINASYSLEGIGYYYNPIEILASDRFLDFTDDNGTFAAAITAKTYKLPSDLAAALQSAMNAADPLETFTVTYSDTTGKFTIATSTSTVLSLLWFTGTNTANTVGDKIGFSVAANDTGATTYTSDNAQSWASPQTPAYDTADPNVAKNNSFLLGDATNNTCFEASSVSISMSLGKANIASICSESGVSGSVINSREVTCSVTALVNQHDADKVRRLLGNTDTRFMYAFGEKSGGNWVAGKAGAFYCPTCTVQSFNVADADGLVVMELELKAFVDASGNGEFYLGFV